MATQREAVAHSRTVRAVVDLATRDVVTVWGSLEGAGVTDTREVLVEVLPDLTGDYGAAVGTVSSDWYDERRTAAGARGRFIASPAAPPSAKDLEALSRWAVAPLVDGDRDAALTRVVGGVQRELHLVDSNTVIGNAKRDPAKPRVARAAQLGACAFCAMLASRGAVYHSEDTALSKRHSFCRCQPITVYPDEAWVPDDHVYGYVSAYNDARAQAGEKPSTKDILTNMRQILGSH